MIDNYLGRLNSPDFRAINALGGGWRGSPQPSPRRARPAAYRPRAPGPVKNSSPGLTVPAASASCRSVLSASPLHAPRASISRSASIGLPPRSLLTIRAHLRPSAIAVTISDWPIRASPHAYTLDTEVR